MLYSAVNNDDDEVDRSEGDDAVSSQSESDDDNEPEEGKFQTPINPVNSVNSVTENTVQHWESSQWFSNARYDYTQSGAFLYIESGTVQLLDWNDSMTDIQLDMRFVDKVQAVLYQTGCTYKQAWYARKFAIERIELKSREHKVTTYNLREGIYMVKSPIRVSGMGNNIYTLRLNNKFCSCGKWKTYTLPCSHVLVVCRENGSRTNAYAPEIYSRQTYIKTYQANFHLVLSENFWRDVPFNLTFYPPNMKNERDRKQGK
ncbi:hypothetical protein M9H77_28181 [Catharanthus roseus]|uniref:Uncharacterized protein n=1 Tax=Catharanthus roseus TaxID=4058 RepID=A0ACC0AHB3_CATRO|nr:hypothetical protein M9H77_28181 [Catharanthus roseus]